MVNCGCDRSYYLRLPIEPKCGIIGLTEDSKSSTGQDMATKNANLLNMLILDVILKNSKRLILKHLRKCNHLFEM